jgi:hypothetical protein
MRTITLTSPIGLWKPVPRWLLLAAIALAGLGAARAQIVAESLWSVSAGGSGWDYGRQIAVDSGGNVIVAGQFGDSATFDQITLVGTASEQYGLGNAFIAKYSSEGTLLWAQAITRSTTNLLSCGLVIRPDDTIYVAAQAFGDNDSRDLVLSKFDADGNLLWTKVKPNIGFSNGAPTKLMGLDGAGNLYLAGGVKAPDFFFQGLIVLKLDAEGNELWRRVSPAGPQGGSSTSVFATGIAVDLEGNCAVTGWFGVPPYSSTYLNLGSVVLHSNNKYSTAFTLKYDSAGDLLWAKVISSLSGISNGAGDVVTDESGAVNVTGSGTLPPENGSNDGLFLVKYDKSGNLAWAKTSAGTGSSSGNKITFAANGNVLVLGQLQGTGALQLDSIDFTNAEQGAVLYFLLVFNPDGQLTAAAELLRAPPSPDTYSYHQSALLMSFTPDASGDIYCSGSFYGSLSLGSTSLTSNPQEGDLFLIKFSGASLGSPILQLVHSADQLLLSWPANQTGFILESTANLSGTNWSAVTNVVNVVGSQNVVSSQLSGQGCFFRLRKP